MTRLLRYSRHCTVYYPQLPIGRAVLLSDVGFMKKMQVNYLLRINNPVSIQREEIMVGVL